MQLFKKNPFGHADRYLIKQMIPRMGVALGITLAALLMERILRLFELVTGYGAEISAVLALALNLVPQYIGLALPAAFCIGILATLNSLSQANEIDALENAGWSLRRIGVPFLLCALAMTLISGALFGIAQPYGRYAYYEVRHAILNAGWEGRVEQNIFVNVDDGLTLSVGDVDPTGRLLYRVFALRNDEGGETVITARNGRVVTSDDGKGLHLVLNDGQMLFPKGQIATFENLPLQRQFDLSNNPFRQRGSSHRELTFFELWERMKPVDGEEAEPRFAVEFHARLMRALSLIAVALMAVPLAVASKRTPAWRQMAVAVAILATYENVIKFVSGMGAAGRIDPALGLWGLFAVFMVLSLLLYVMTPSQGTTTPFRLLFRVIGTKPITAIPPEVMVPAGERGSS